LHYVLFVKLLEECHVEYNVPTRGERVRFHCVRQPPRYYIRTAFQWEDAPGGYSFWANLDVQWQKRVEELTKNNQPDEQE
jgi:hypothetical protein